MFIDKANIFVKAGDGGDGAVSFRREIYVPNGGPDGGNGGNGGNVIIKVSPHTNNLVNFYYNKHYRAENGVNGGKNNRFGKNGKDMIIEVPRGTIVRDSESGRIISDLYYENDELLLLKGGIGGRGNAMFANSVRQAPKFSEQGVKTKEKQIILELKTIADVGLVGYPNVGKSTLLSIISKAKPKIANYHFTTLNPNLGVASYSDKSFLVADIPGLIEGASQGTGLGHEFLRHIERTRMIVHVVDISGIEGRDPIRDFETINNELASYSKNLSKIKQIVVLNKCDLLEPESNNVSDFKKLYSSDYEIIEMSAVSYKGIDSLLKKIAETIDKLPIPEPHKPEIYDFDSRDTKSLVIKKDSSNVFEVAGGLIDEIIRGVVLDDIESFTYFQKRLKNDGVIDKLIEKGLKDGDIVRIGEIEFEYSE